MAVVAVPFILYLVRFCSSKSCTSTRTVRVEYQGTNKSRIRGDKSRIIRGPSSCSYRTVRLSGNRCAGVFAWVVRDDAASRPHWTTVRVLG